MKGRIVYWTNGIITVSFIILLIFEVFFRELLINTFLGKIVDYFFWYFAGILTVLYINGDLKKRPGNDL